MTLLDIKTEEDETSNKKLKKKDYNRPDDIKTKQSELKKFFKFSVVETVLHTLWGAEILHTTWVVPDHGDHVNMTGSKKKARLCTMGNSSEKFLKDSIQFASPTCGRDTVKAILSLVPDNKRKIGTFDVSLAFFQGDTLERDVYV